MICILLGNILSISLLFVIMNIITSVVIIGDSFSKIVLRTDQLNIIGYSSPRLSVILLHMISLHVLYIEILNHSWFVSLV